MTFTISLIVAVADNNVIGKDNKMPWHISEDFKHFKEVTMGKPCIMGRKTYESILEQLGKPLPKRTSIVVTRNPRLSLQGEGNGASSQSDVSAVGEGTIIATSLDEAIEKAKAETKSEIMVIGGSQIYALALPLADRIYLTRVHQEPEGDAFFPEFGPDWIESDIEHHDGFSFVTLERNQ